MTDPTFLAALYVKRHPREAAEFVDGFQPRDIAELLATLPDDSACDLLTTLVPNKAAKALEELSDEDGAQYLGMMHRREAASILRNLQRDRRERFLQAMSTPTRIQLELILLQPSHRVGAWTESVPFALTRDTTVEAARRRLRSVDVAINEIYIIDDKRHLVGLVPLFRLYAVAGAEPVGSISQPLLGSLRANSGLESALENPAWKKADSLPVLDHEGALVGTLRHATLREAVSQHGVVEMNSRSDDYMGVANNLYVGLAEVLVTSIGRISKPKAPPAVKGGSS